MVRFDTPYPFGEKADEYDKLAKEVSTTNNLLIADVGIEEYGDKFNSDLGEKFGVKAKEDMPKLLLFKKDSLDNPVAFKGEWKSDNFKAFIKEHSKLKLLLEGCVSELDDLAEKFASSEDKESKEKLLAEASKVIEGLEGKDKTSGDIYKKLMQRVIERGDKFILSELERVRNLLSEGKMKDAKKKDLQQRINIIQSFRNPSQETIGDSKSEL